MLKNNLATVPLASVLSKKITEAAKKEMTAAANQLPVTKTKTNVYIANDGSARTAAESTAAAKALGELDKWRASRPGEYKSSYTNSINSIIKALTDRKFSYDSSTDPLYKQYRDSYMRNARLAYDDMLGKASALSGGFYNSAAGSAAANQYTSTLRELSDVIPELYEAAYDRYTDEGETLLDRLSMLEKLDDNEWKKYSSLLSDYLNEGKTLMSNYATLSGKDIDTFLDIAELMYKYNK